jgi:RES domain-containing protein
VRLWRLALGRYHRLDGEGARLYGGRWNSPGTPVVYTATHLTLALLEQLVHLDPNRLPAAFRAFSIVLADDLPVETVGIAAFDVLACRQFGDAWAASLRSAALVVPSAVVPASLQPGEIATDERNVLLNPRHRSARSWQVTETGFRIDPRLRRARGR